MRSNWIKIIAAFVVGNILFIAISNAWIIESTKKNVFSQIEELPERQTGLILGTSDKLSNGTDNLFFKTRMEMAAALYNAGKVKHLLVSGDNRSIYYNEPQKMRKALTDLGVPESAITLDYAGLRTLDSIIRCKEIFGQNDIVVITQEFHCYRALFISNYYKLNAVAMATVPVPKSLAINTVLREIFARPKAIWDTYIANTAPKFMGEQEIINTEK